MYAACMYAMYIYVHWCQFARVFVVYSSACVCVGVGGRGHCRVCGNENNTYHHRVYSIDQRMGGKTT